MSISNPTLRLVGDLLSLHQHLSSYCHRICMALSVAMADTEFDACWPKVKAYAEAGICGQLVFDIVNNNPIP